MEYGNKMGLMKKLMDVGRSTKLAWTLAGSLFLAPFFSAGCGTTDSGNGGGEPNAKPTINITQCETTGTENLEHKVTFDVADAEDDPVFVNIYSGPTGVGTAEPVLTATGVNSYEITWTPDDTQSDTTHYYTIEATDLIDHDNDTDVDADDSTFETTNLIYINNVENASGRITEAGTGVPVAGLRVRLHNPTYGYFYGQKFK